MPNPTPNLTAESDISAAIAIAAEARRLAFEEAAEAAPELVRLLANEGLFHGPGASGYNTVDEAESVATEVLIDALRALAEEKADDQRD